MQPHDAGGKSPLVLFVDDTQEVLDLMTDTFESEGYTVLTADNGQDALRTFTSQPVDAVVLDYEMPGMNGVQVAREMKRLKPHVFTLLFTAEPAMIQTEEAVDIVLGKSEGVKALAAILRRLLDESGTPPAIRRSPRYSVEMAVMINVSRSDDLTYRGCCTNIAEGGLGGEVDGDLVLGELVRLNISAEAFDVNLELSAQVRHRNNENYGFAFVDLSAAEQGHVRSFCQRLASA